MAAHQLALAQFCWVLIPAQILIYSRIYARMTTTRTSAAAV